MFSFTVKGKLYGVKFYRSERDTTAEFMEVDQSTGKLDITGIKATAYCNKNDRFEKSKGRKVALAKLLKHLQESFDGKTALLLTKGQRRDIVWSAYFKVHKKK